MAPGSLIVAMFVFALTSSTAAQDSTGVSAPEPALPHFAKDACPFEGCAYREWTALKDMPVFDTFREARREVGTIRKGEKVVALGGFVVTYRPGVIFLDRDVPEAGLRRGDRILTYAYIGEGFSQVWVNGRFYEQYDISFTKWPDGTGCGGTHCAATYLDLGQKAWWAELRLASGATTWVDMDSASFDGVDQLTPAELAHP